MSADISQCFIINNKKVNVH